MNKFTFKALGWYNSPRTINVLAKKGTILTEELTSIIKEAFLEAKSLTSRRESEFNSFIFPSLGDVNQAVFELFGYVHMFESLEEKDLGYCDATLKIRKIEKV